MDLWVKMQTSSKSAVVEYSVNDALTRPLIKDSPIESHEQFNPHIAFWQMIQPGSCHSLGRVLVCSASTWREWIDRGGCRWRGRHDHGRINKVWKTNRVKTENTDLIFRGACSD